MGVGSCVSGFVWICVVSCVDVCMCRLLWVVLCVCVFVCVRLCVCVCVCQMGIDENARSMCGRCYLDGANTFFKPSLESAKISQCTCVHVLCHLQSPANWTMCLAPRPEQS